MQNISLNLSKFRHASRVNRVIAGCAGLVVLAIGYYLIVSHAAGFVVSIEPEDGTRTTNASLTSDGSASGGKAVQFNAPAPAPPPPPPPPPPPTNCTTQVWQQLEACGWPGPSNTGYPAGQAFSNTINGTYTVTTNGAVIDGWRVTNGIIVRASNVIIRNSWITSSLGGAGGSGVININPGFSADIQHNLLDGKNATHACVWHEGSSMTAKFNHCQGVNDGMFSWASNTGVDGTGDNFDIEDNYFHAFTTAAANGHIDGYQTEGAKNGTIRHNTFDVSQDQDSAVAIWNGRKSTDNILVDNNLMAGGGFAVYAEDYSPSEASPVGGYTLTNVRFTNNKFSNVHYGCVGTYGVWFFRSALAYQGGPTDGWHRTGNIVLETGASVDNGNPTFNGAACN